MRKAIPWSAVLLVLIGIVVGIIATPSGSAQSIDCNRPVSCSYSSQDGGCYPPIPPGAFDCFGMDFSTYCKVIKYECIPENAPLENPRCIECMAALAGKPIQLANGNTYIDQTDVSIPGLGGGLVLRRSWNSLWPSTQYGFRIGMFGPNWISNYEEHIFVGSDNYIKYLHSDGNFWSFGYNSSNWLPSAPSNAPAVLTQTATTWVLAFKNGEQRVFSLTSGLLTSITDRNGNTTTLSYDGLNRLATVTDPASRHLTFTYSGNSYLVSGVSSDVGGLSLSYTYDSNGRLLQVTRPGQTSLNFEYATFPFYYKPLTPNPYITAVKDGSGKVLEAHSYDCYGRGLSSERAGGAESVTVTYSDSTYSGVCGGGRVRSAD